jgi:hypothetical protein
MVDFFGGRVRLSESEACIETTTFKNNFNNSGLDMLAKFARNSTTEYI